ncbi:MAG: hypothetical protein R6W68_01285 [Ignavibacteriaceae bacterium]
MFNKKRTKEIKSKSIFNVCKGCIALLVSSLIMLACSSETNPIIHYGKNAEIYPLAIGNKWEYSRFVYDINHYIIGKDTISTEIDRANLKNGVEWFGIAFSWGEISKQTDGIWMQHTQAPLEPIPSLVYKYPTFSGDSYPYWKVISTQKMIKIGLGYFMTIQYRFLKNSETNEYIDYFLYPGIGLIKSKNVRKDSSGIYYTAIEEELIKYIVN